MDMDKDNTKPNQRPTGWILLHRKIQDHWLWEDDKNLKRWLTILLYVNHSPKKFTVGAELHTCEPGSSFIKLESWGRILKTDKNHVKKFFELLQSDGMILCQILGRGNQRKHLLTVVNWKEYQNIGTEEKPLDTLYSSNFDTHLEEKTQNQYQTGTAPLLDKLGKNPKSETRNILETIPKTYPEQRMNKEGINKEEYIAQPKFKKPTIDEVKEYCQERKNSVNPSRFFDHYEANGWKQKGGQSIKDWKAAVRTWEGNEFNKPVGQTNSVLQTNENPLVSKENPLGLPPGQFDAWKAYHMNE
jgi:hypothetical protein